MTVMMRVEPATRDRVMQVAKEDFGGVTADETLQKLLDEHWERKCVEAVERYAEDDPDGYADYLAEAEEWDAISAPVTDPWDEAPA
jgi:ABC-type taurine transport system substrate-binding protein